MYVIVKYDGFYKNINNAIDDLMKKRKKYPNETFKVVDEENI